MKGTPSSSPSWTGLARSLPDARDIADELTRKGVSLSLGGSVHDSTDPVGRLLFNVLGMVAEFEADLIRMRAREGMAVAKEKGRLRGKQPKVSVSQRRHILELHDAGGHTQEGARRAVQRLSHDDLPRVSTTSRRIELTGSSSKVGAISGALTG